MLRPEQEKWINSLSNTPVKIVPYDLRTERLFLKVREKIYEVLGSNIEVEHVGASSFGISGQDEIDVSIVVDKHRMEEYIPKLEAIFGAVQSRYADRARFEVREEGKRIDLKIIDRNHPNYIRGKRFEDHLRNNPVDLDNYRILKESCAGNSTKEYYRKKTEFINEILDGNK